jgi:hypothetical protein
VGIVVAEYPAVLPASELYTVYLVRIYIDLWMDVKEISSTNSAVPEGEAGAVNKGVFPPSSVYGR